MPGKEKAKWSQPRHEAVRIRWAALVGRTTAAGSTAAHLQVVVSKCAFAGVCNKKEGVQVTPERPASASPCRSITALPACAILPQMNCQPYVFGGRIHPLHSTSQKAVLSKYAADNGFSNPVFFIDDGVSGVTFDRPNFNRMIAEIEAGNVATVIVKDMSRLGRDYLKVGYYTEIFFVERDVRYIAINDGVDSEKGDNDFTPFRNLFNDFYAKDTSKKVRAIKRA